jgi:hypothetical protein
MILVLVPHLGVTVNGARRWFDAGPLGTFQPSELGKLASALWVAHWIDRNSSHIGDFQKGFLPIAAMLAGVLALLMLEKDVGTSIIVVAIFLGAFWAGGGRFRHVILLLAVLSLAFLAVTLFEPYRFARFISFKNPWADPLGAGFQSTQALYGLGSGGFFEVRLAARGTHGLHLRDRRRGDRPCRHDARDGGLSAVCVTRLSRRAARPGSLWRRPRRFHHNLDRFRGAFEHGHGHQHTSHHWRAAALFQLWRHRDRDLAGGGRRVAQRGPARHERRARTQR